MELEPHQTADAVRFALVGVLGLLALAVTAWIFWSAFRGPDRARRALGTHRLALASIVFIFLLGTLIALPFATRARIDCGGFTIDGFIIGVASTDVPMLAFIYSRLIASRAVSWRELGLAPLPLSYVLRMGFGGGLVGLIGVAVVGALLAQVGVKSNQSAEFQFVTSQGPLVFILVLLVAGVLAPCVEELFFRGFIFGFYRRRKPLWMAYVASSLLFTVLHLQPQCMTPAQMAGLAVGILQLALLLAWLYQRSGSLYPGMVAHAVNNATGLILLYAVGLQ